MSLLTRCPRCKTLFRVAPAQLQARAGQVRCGRCLNVFDGYQALAGEPPNAAGEPEPAAMPSVAPALDAGAVFEAAPVRPAPARSAPPAGAARSAGAPAVPDIPPPVRAPLTAKPERTVSGRMKWTAGCVALGVLLGAQAVYAFRSDLAARYPVFRTAFNSLCDVAGCTVSLPQRPELVRIEASDVHVIDASRPSLIQVTATLRSYASYDLAYPALDLVLTNANEHALARRIFVPGDYLDRTRDPKAGIPPRGEFTVALDLDTGDLKAVGFRLDLLAAPAP